jgi:hypothetical protein
MSDVVSEVPVTAGSPDPDATAAFGVHAAESPPLTWLTVLAALVSLVINQLLLPALGPDVKTEVLLPVAKSGAFATNLAATSGLIALGFGLLVFVRFSQQFELRQRLLLTMFSAAFLLSIALATLFEQQQTTAEGVLLAIAAAQVLIGLLGTSAARSAPSVYRRAVGLLCSAMGASVLCSQLLQVISQRRLDAWMSPTQHGLQLLGETCYLVLLLVLTPLVLPSGADLRSRLARMTGFFLLPVGLGGLYLAERTHQHDYALLLYHAQRVTMWIDAYPRAYSVPLALALAAGIAGGLGPHAGRRQAAAGTLLLLASGYAPYSPGRLLTSVLGVLLISRSIIASGQPDAER